MKSKNTFGTKPAGLMMAGDLKTIKGKIAYWILFSLVLAMALITVIPVIWMVLTAFKSTPEIYSSTSFFPQDMSLSTAWGRISEAWIKLDLVRSIINTIIVSLGNVIAGVLFPGLAGYILSKKKVAGTKVVFTLVVWSMMLPNIVRTVPRFMSYLSFPFIIDDAFNLPTNISILNTYWPIWLLHGLSCFNVILFKNNFDAISDSLVESAELDGCSTFQTFYKIMLPIAAPIVFYVAIGQLSGAWADYLNPYLILSDANLYTVPTRLYLLKSDANISTNNYLMGLMFACIPPAFIYLVLQRKIMGGMMDGAVKG